MLEDLKPHIADLRKRLIYSVAALIVMFFACFGFWEIILGWMIVPLEEALPPEAPIIFTKIHEQFFTAVKVSLFAGFIFALPVIFWQLWLFIAPGLYENEKRMILPFVIFATTMFISGAMFAYYIVFPYGFAYLINFGNQMFTAMPSIGEYVNFFGKLMFGFGISFELPVITLFLAKLGMVTDQTLKDYFKYAIVLIFVLSALLTPPDLVTQFMMSIPLIVLYGVSILIARAINPHKPDEEEDEDDLMEEESPESSSAESDEKIVREDEEEYGDDDDYLDKEEPKSDPENPDGGKQNPS